MMVGNIGSPQNVPPELTSHSALWGEQSCVRHMTCLAPAKLACFPEVSWRTLFYCRVEARYNCPLCISFAPGGKMS